MLNGSNLFEREDQDVALGEFDDLRKLLEVVDWEAFRPLLREIFGRSESDEAVLRGRASWDVMLMFRVLLLGVNDQLSDRQLQFQLLDRRSFKRFVGLRNESTVPDQKTIWKYRHRLAASGRTKELFEAFEAQLREAGYALTGGQIVDSTMVEIPRQRNTREENAALKQGDVPEDWQQQPRKLAQKDVEATWTKKHGVSHYGYKNHVTVDRQYKLVRNYETTTASTHDSQVLTRILRSDKDDGRVWGDGAYRSQALEEELKKRGHRSRIHYKGYRNHPLTTHQKYVNRLRSRIRVRVEHGFGSMVNEMKRTRMRCIGQQRAATWIGLCNLCYNMRRFAFLQTATASAG